MHVLILSDNWNQYNEYRQGIRRNSSAHVMANFLREHSISVDVVDFLHDFTVDELSNIIKNNKPEFVNQYKQKKLEYFVKNQFTFNKFLPDPSSI